jgi:hypothetical protein
MKLMHYSNKQIDSLDLKRKYQNFYGDPKPTGLWVSVENTSVQNGNGWKEWCISEEYEEENLAHKHEIIPKANANIARLTSYKTIKRFNGRYGIVNPWPSFMTRLGRIDWTSVKKYYQGIIVTKYYSRYWMEFPWLYGWDCASGCIWDLSCIEKFRHIRARKVKAVSRIENV